MATGLKGQLSKGPLRVATVALADRLDSHLIKRWSYWSGPQNLPHQNPPGFISQEEQILIATNVYPCQLHAVQEGRVRCPWRSDFVPYTFLDACMCALSPGGPSHLVHLLSCDTLKNFHRNLWCVRMCVQSVLRKIHGLTVWPSMGILYSSLSPSFADALFVWGCFSFYKFPFHIL